MRAGRLAVRMARWAVCAVWSAPVFGATLYISPQGNDRHDGMSREHPLRTFAQAFAAMKGGDTLVLLDGEYLESETGGIASNGPRSGQPPSGSPEHPTVIAADTPGQAVLRADLVLGQRQTKTSHVTLQGMTALAHVSLYNTDHVTLKSMGAGAGLSIGTNDHDAGNTYDLIEDVWVWARGERGIAVNYRAHHNVWRRVVVRGDGCGRPECQGDGNPNIGFTVYDSHDVSVQNMIVVDRMLSPGDAPYGDFAAASHTGGLYTFGRNEWLGTLSINAPDIGYYLEPDVGTVEVPTIRIANAVAAHAAFGGFNLARAGRGNVIENISASTRTGDAVRIAPDLGADGTLRNVRVQGSGRFGINSAYTPQQIQLTGTWSEGPFNQARPLSSRLPAATGAVVRQRYGVDGSRFGDPGYNALTSAPLWPWPNEARIRREMCTATTRGFCKPGGPTFSNYIREQVGSLAVLTPQP